MSNIPSPQTPNAPHDLRWLKSHVRGKERAAALFAYERHSAVGQKRSGTGADYIEHPAEVVELLRSVTRDEDMLCAAWLHDVDEDTRLQHETSECVLGIIAHRFGVRVAGLVRMLTNVATPEDGIRHVRVAINIAHSAAADPDAQTIKYADIWSNTRNIVDTNPRFASIYLPEKLAQLEAMPDGDRTLRDLALRSVCEGIAALDVKRLGPPSAGPVL